MTRRLIINADDYGYARRFNKGIIESAGEKIIQQNIFILKLKS